MSNPTDKPDAACREIRQSVLWASKESGHGHIPTSFSVVELLYSAYSVMRHDPKKPDWDERDMFILSKGHAALGHYATLAHFGYFDANELSAFGAHGSRFGCHADRFKVPGAEASTGSLGHGIGLAVGMALANRIRKTDRKIYVLIGDGESNEGSVWEAVMVAANLKLANLTILFDGNMSQSRSLQITDAADRFRAFKAEAHQVDGHDVAALQAALQAEAETVKVIVADTIKGHGCRTLTEEMFAWHRRSPKEDEYQQLLKELDA